jgi:hypothetical protein
MDIRLLECNIFSRIGGLCVILIFTKEKYNRMLKYRIENTLKLNKFMLTI